MTDAVLDTGAALPTVSSSTDADPAPDPRTDRTSPLGRALGAVREAVTVATLLRTLGALAIVGSLSLYLLQGFGAQGDLTRVLTLLGQSALLAAAGLLVGFALREPKGARVFLTLALVSVPANFAVLGAMIYSIAPLDGGQLGEHLPAFATWRAENVRGLWRALGAGLVVLLPITAFAFAVLARHRTASLSLALLAASATLLVPLRLPSVTIVAAGVLLVAVVTFIARRARRAADEGRPTTFDERMAHALLLIPPGILLGRTVLGHGVDVDSAMPLAMAAWYLLHGLLGSARGTVRRQRLVATLGTVAGLGTAALSVPLLAGALGPAALLLAFALVSAVLCRQLARRCDEPGARRLIGALASAALLVPVVGLVVVGAHGIGVLAVGALVAVGVVAHGVLEGRTGRTLAGALALLALLWTQADVVTTFVLGGGWHGLAAAGVATIVAGSLTERFGPMLKLRFERAREARQPAALDETAGAAVGANG